MSRRQLAFWWFLAGVLFAAAGACEAFTTPVTCRVTGVDTVWVSLGHAGDSVPAIVTREWCE